MSFLLALLLAGSPPTMPVGEPPVRLAAADSGTIVGDHFRIEAPDAATAKRVREVADQARADIHARWFGERGRAVPQWGRRVTIQVHREHPGFYATEITSDGVALITVWAGDPHLESTVRHEVWHAVVHLRYLGKPIPRWIDEGIAVCNESAAEQKRTLAPLIKAERRFRVRDLCGFRQYPGDMAMFYAQGYSLTDYLVRTHGERDVIRFLEASFKSGQEAALKDVLGYASFEDLEKRWKDHLSASLEPLFQRR